MTTPSKSAHARSVLQNNMFWVSVLLLAAGSVGCFGYAGIQLKANDKNAPPPPSEHRQDDDGIGNGSGRSGGSGGSGNNMMKNMLDLKKVRQPVLFERTRAPNATTTSSGSTLILST